MSLRNDRSLHNNTAVGIHTSADGGLGVGWEQPVRAEIAALQPEVIKFQSNHDPKMIDALLADNKQHLRTVIVRAFLSWGNARLTPAQFVQATVNDTKRAVNQIKAHGFPSKNIIIELHNEPNLTLEGLNLSWQNGTDCMAFFADVLDQYKALMRDLRYGLGALSPGKASKIRQDSTLFLDEMRQHPRWREFDVHLVHLYTVGAWADEIWWLDHCQARTPNMPVWITESSFHTADTTPGSVYAAKLAELLPLLDRRPTRGVTFYCVSASNLDFYHEAWCRSQTIPQTHADSWKNVVSRGIAAELRRVRPLAQRNAAVSGG